MRIAVDPWRGLLCWDDRGEPVRPPAPHARVTRRDTGEVLDCFEADDVAGVAVMPKRSADGLILLSASGLTVDRERVQAPLKIEFHGG